MRRKKSAAVVFVTIGLSLLGVFGGNYIYGPNIHYNSPYLCFRIMHCQSIYSPNNSACTSDGEYTTCVDGVTTALFWKCVPAQYIGCDENSANSQLRVGYCSKPNEMGGWTKDLSHPCTFTLYKCDPAQ